MVYFILNAIYTSTVFAVRLGNGSFDGTTKLIVHLIFMTADNSLVLACISCLVLIREMEEYVNHVICTDQLLSG